MSGTSFRLEVKDEGDDDNTRKSKRDRKAQALVSEAKKDFQPDDDAPAKDAVEEWLTEMQADAEFNTSAYVDCFLSENLVRKYIGHKSLSSIDCIQKEILKLKEREEKTNRERISAFRYDKPPLI